jgi:hypothetical protein
LFPDGISLKTQIINIVARILRTVPKTKLNEI